SRNPKMKIGVAVRDLGPSQLNYSLVRQANALLAVNPTLDLTVFYEHHVRPCLPLAFASMLIQEMWSYDGPVVATTLSTAEKALRCPGPPRVLFYQWDLDWLRLGPFRHGRLAQFYREPRLTPLVRCIDHSLAFEQAW